VPDQPFSVDHDDSASSLTVVGEVDEPHAAALRDAIEHHSSSYTADLVVDLSGVTYLPSVAVGVIATSRQKLQASGATLELVASDGSIAQRVLTVCALPYRTA
jgi:anti-anti-sigma factor